MKKENFYFLLLAVFFLALRLIPIWGGNFPYAYDNAKDSLVLMQMWYFGKPALLGAVTSLPGLWQGPFWYYVFFPINVLVGFHPLASVLTVVFLGLFTTWLFWKYLGKLEALLFTTSTAIIVTQQTAWSPYLTLFSTAWILVLFRLMQKKTKPTHLILLGLAASLLFHSEIAFGVVFCPLLILVLYLKKLRFSFRQLFFLTTSFLLPFIPQFIFEARHNFLQTKSVINFIVNFGQEASGVQGNQTGLARVIEVAGNIAKNGLDSILPYSFDIKFGVAVIIIGLFLLVLLTGKSEEFKRWLKSEFLPIILGSFLLYLFLPLKPFYLIGLTPFWILAFAKVLKTRFGKLNPFIVAIFVILALFNMLVSKSRYQELAKTSDILFEPQRQAVDVAYQLAEGEPFSSYHYLPEVYDYTYQQIYQYTAKQKQRFLPVEYSYAPGEKDYLQTKKMFGPKLEPIYTILIVEEDKRPQFFPTWFDNQTRSKKIIKTVEVNKAITVYQLIDEKK